MKKYPFWLFVASLLLVSCGSPKPAVVKTSPAPVIEVMPRPVFNDTIPITPEPEPENTLPSIPPTIYAPYLRRTETPAPALPIPSNECHLAVEVREYDGLDGCGLLLETDSGNLFLVGNTPRGEPLEAGTRISIGYEYMKDFQGSDCANADAVIRVTCMRLLRVSSGIPRPIVCEAYDQPSEWLADLARDYSANYITRFPWDDGRYVYLLETALGQYLYDCRGYLICKPRKNCLGFIKDFSNGVVIFEG
ncbi:MAG: hypothetical protein AAF840_01310 [Bacteroidota bacterium]